eukprot:762521-Hanusia_phi.AAC.17
MEGRGGEGGGMEGWDEREGTTAGVTCKNHPPRKSPASPTSRGSKSPPLREPISPPCHVTT